jgi:hypothetical protein
MKQTRQYCLLFAAAGNASAVGWSAGTQVSPTGYPDPTRGSQINTAVVNKNGLAVAVWDQFNYNNDTYNIDVNVETAGRWGDPLTISNLIPGQYYYCQTPPSVMTA